MKGSSTLPGHAAFGEGEHCFRSTFRTWLDEHPPPPRPLRPNRPYVDACRHWQSQLADAGYGVPHWPVEHGGSDVVGHQLVQLEELATVGVDHRLLLAGLHVVGPVLALAGTDQQRALHLSAIQHGEELWTLLLSEPGAGSDLAAITTRAEQTGRRLVIHGQKVWNTWAHFADYGLLLCRIGSRKDRRGVCLIMIPMSSPAVTVRPIRQMNGDSEFNEVFIDGLEVDVDDIVGDPDHHWHGVRSMLAVERSGVALTYYASMAVQLDEVRDQMNQPETALRLRFAKLYSDIAVQRLNALRTASKVASPDESLAVASMAKLQTGINRRNLAELQLETAGAYGLVHDGDAGRAWAVDRFLFSPSAGIAAGTTEVQKNALAERALGLPR